MSDTIGLVLLVVLLARVGSAAGSCVHVPNDDMIEYSCMGGRSVDLNSIPANAEKIKISGMSIPRITADMFSRFGSNLWVLACSHCEIMDIDDNAFQRLDNLQQLSLDSNHLTTVKAAWFQGLNYLTFLDLNYNNIHTIEDGVYMNLPSLVDFRISGNRLNCINVEAMSNLRGLKRIFLTENPDFRCPNAVSRFLENRGVSFERDPEWSRIPDDTVHIEIPPDFPTTPDWKTTPIPWQTTPPYRERPYYPVTTSTPVPETPRTPYMTRRPSARPPYPPVTFTEPPTPRTPERPTYPSYQETTPGRQSPWPSESEPDDYETDEYPVYPPENEYPRQPHYPSEATMPPLLATSQNYQTARPSSFMESNVERTTEAPMMHYTPNTDDRFREDEYKRGYGSPEYPATPTDQGSSGPTHVVRPYIPPVLHTVPPASPDDFVQAPYYEPTVTVHPHPLDNYQERGRPTEGVMPLEIETTTDKPLPQCPSASTNLLHSVELTLISVLIVALKNII